MGRSSQESSRKKKSAGWSTSLRRRITFWPTFRTSIFWIFVLVIFILAWSGFQKAFPDDSWDNIYRTFTLFFFSGSFADISGAAYSEFESVVALHDNILLQVARFFAPLIVFFAILFIFLDRVRRLVRSVDRSLFFNNHTVVIGLSEQGKRFAISEAEAEGHRVIAIESGEDPSVDSFCHLHGIHLVEGDGAEDKVLKSARVQKAKSIIVISGDDTRNLSIVDTIAKKMKAPSGASNPRNQTIFLHVHNPTLAASLTRRDTFLKQPRAEIKAFSVARLAAIEFFQTHPLWSYALLRAQRRIHAVFIGFSETAEQLLLQLCRLAPHAHLDWPQATIFTEAPEVTRTALLSAYPEIDQACRITHRRSHPLEAGAIDETTMGDVADETGLNDTGSSITAIFVCLEKDHHSLAAAMQLRAATARAARWRAPIYVHLRTKSGFEHLADPESKQIMFDGVLEGFGAIDDLCTLDRLSGGRERLARTLHEAYGEFLKTKPDRTDAAADKVWADLDETYRESNRRAVDHVPVKLASIGYALRPVDPNREEVSSSAVGRSCFSAQEKEQLARLEHQSWQVDRWLDGWRYGRTRDNSRRIHNNLCDFDDLDDKTKEYDYKMIDTLDKNLEQFLGKMQNHAFRNFTIGLFGHNDIERGKEDYVRNTFQDLFKDASSIHAEHFVTLLTPLAPGADLLLTIEATRILKKQNRPFRLIIVEAVPYQKVIDDFKAHWMDGKAWGGCRSIEGKEWRDARKIMINREEEVKAMVGPDLSDHWIVDLTPPGMSLEQWSHPDISVEGYRRAAAYLVERSNLLIAYHDPQRTGGPGGTAETLEWREDPLRIPPRYSSLCPRQKANWPAWTECQTIPPKPADDTEPASPGDDAVPEPIQSSES